MQSKGEGEDSISKILEQCANTTTNGQQEQKQNQQQFQDMMTVNVAQMQQQMQQQLMNFKTPSCVGPRLAYIVFTFILTRVFMIRTITNCLIPLTILPLTTKPTNRPTTYLVFSHLNCPFCLQCWDILFLLRTLCEFYIANYYCNKKQKDKIPIQKRR